MKTKLELEQDILQITLKIDNEFPELSKYIKEIPVKVTENTDEIVNIQNLADYYNSLNEILESYSKTHYNVINNNENVSIKFPSYPLYPSSDDIYEKGIKEMDLNPSDISKIKVPNEIPDMRNEKDFNTDMSDSDLDIPGAELDNQQESVGSEDEENNYYSLCGDNHKNLDENNV